MEYLTHAFGSADVALLFNRLALGGFFVLARFRWFYDPSRPEAPWLNCARHNHLIERLCTCGYSKHPYLSGMVASVEVLGGLALIVGLLTPLAAVGLFVILLGATYCTATEKTLKQQPVDKVDCVSCYLWTVEPLYLMLALSIIIAGPGKWSLDWWLFG